MRAEQLQTLPLHAWLAELSASERAIIARGWLLPIELATSPGDLAAQLSSSAVVARMLAGLSEREQAALRCVLAYGGQVATGIIEDTFGHVRVAESYPNPRAYLMAFAQPPEPTERLYLLGLVQRAGYGRDSFYIIPHDLMAVLPPVPLRSTQLDLTPQEPPTSMVPSDLGALETMVLDLLGLAYAGQLETIGQGALNKASLVRLARRRDPKEKLTGVVREEQWLFVRFVRCVLTGAGLVRTDADGTVRPTREALEWMQLDRTTRMGRLLTGWIRSDWDELTTLVGLRIMRAFQRDISSDKQALLNLIRHIPDGHWYRLEHIVAAIAQTERYYLRPSGDFSSWSIRDRYGRPLDGSEHWNAVEGSQIQTVLVHTCWWLGLVDCGVTDGRVSTIRLTSLGAALLRSVPAPAEQPAEPIVLQPNFEIVVLTACSVYARFQVGRIAELVTNAHVSIFRLTRQSVQAALERGIGITEILAFLHEQSGREVPQNVAATLTGWAGEYGRVSLRRVVLLEADDATLLERIRRDRKVQLPSVEELAPQSWVIADGEAAPLAERLRQAGYGLAHTAEGPVGLFETRDLTFMLEAVEFYLEAAPKLGLDVVGRASLRKRLQKSLPDRFAARAIQSSRTALEQLRRRLEGRE